MNNILETKGRKVFIIPALTKMVAPQTAASFTSALNLPTRKIIDTLKIRRKCPYNVIFCGVGLMPP
jgi:formylmethanofuran dehydrogenase subunit B